MDALERLQALKELSPVDIAKLPEMGHEQVEIIDGKSVKFITWHDRLDTGEHRVVVAAYEVHRLASYRVRAVGFALNERGAIRELTVQELDGFE